MPWPDLFWKSRKPKTAPEAPAAPESRPEAVKAILPEPQPPTIKPVPATATVVGASTATPTPVAVPVPIPTPVKIEPKVTPTIAATHGVVLRPPTGRTVTANATTPQILPPRAINPPKALEPMKNIEQLMAEADPVRTLRQTGNVRGLAPLTSSAPETAPLAPPPIAKSTPAPKVEPVPRTTMPVTAIPPSADLRPVPTPTFRPAVTAPFSQSRRIEPTPAKPVIARTPAPTPVPTPVAMVVPTPIPQPPLAVTLAKPVAAPDDDSPFILKSAPPAATAPSGGTKILPPSPPTLLPLGAIFPRKARMADIARIVLPPKREDTQQLQPAPAKPAESSATVVPPAFPVAAMTARATQHLPKIAEPEKIVVEGKPAEMTPPPFSAPDNGDDSLILKPARAKSEPVDIIPAGIVGTSNTELPALDKAFDFTPPGYQQPTPVIAPTTVPISESKLIEPSLPTNDAPKIDPEAHRPAATATPEPKIDPEAHKPEFKPAEPKPMDTKPVEAVPVEPIPVPPASAAALSSAPAAPEKREFHLSNGERVAGTVLSETPEAIYVEHSTLGVITIPRANIAKRLVEIILVNGDRIVGDILAETADTLYVRHASLGMLTVPRVARSTRVVEAILKDGDRILGEMLTETDTFTVIRSASLGTITIPHSKLAMLNRKVEQIEMRSLPPVTELKDKS